MKIVMIAENDPAGMAIAFTNAINRYTEHTARLITWQTRYNVNFEADIHLPHIAEEDFGEIEALLTEADIFHFHMLADENMVLGPLLIRDYIGSKGLLHHHHGHPNFMVNADTYRLKYEQLRRRAIVSTPDLLRVLPGSTWVPNLVPIRDVQFLPLAGPAPAGEVRICQAPTRTYNKDTRTFLKVMGRIEQRFPHVHTVMIENAGYTDCLRAKRRCHIVFDHLRGHFGISSLESLSQGKPVLAGLDEFNIEQIRAFTGVEQIPWVVAHDAESLEEQLVELIQDPALRDDIGRRARRFMEAHWTEQAALERLLAVYQQL